MDLSTELVEVLRGCREAHPDLAVDFGMFVAYVAARRPLEMTLEEWGSTVHATDLYLAYACVAGTPGAREHAIRELDERFAPELDGVLRKLDRHGVDEDSRSISRERLRRRLFAGDSAKIGTYSGRGSLQRWIRVAATRVAMELDQARRDGMPADEDPTTARYRAAFDRAFADALPRLTDRQRTVLAQYHVDGLCFEELGRLYEVHRVTAARWVVRAHLYLRQTILDQLGERLELAGIGTMTERDRVARFVRDQLALGLSAALLARRSSKRRRPRDRAPTLPDVTSCVPALEPLDTQLFLEPVRFARPRARSAAGGAARLHQRQRR